MATIAQPVHSENISPRTRFQMSGVKLTNHRDLIAREDFRIAIDTALLQYQADLALNCKDQYQAMSNGLRMLGANEFIAVLRKLADKDELPAPTKPNDNLRS